MKFLKENFGRKAKKHEQFFGMIFFLFLENITQQSHNFFENKYQVLNQKQKMNLTPFMVHYILIPHPLNYLFVQKFNKN